ncbi:MAG: DUF799 family lipoprotein [Deltaproteobacteria bacterium]|nr:DUF799 family lipoprotein [Deltaproteobacteria bacterium]
MSSESRWQDHCSISFIARGLKLKAPLLWFPRLMGFELGCPEQLVALRGAMIILVLILTLLTGCATTDANYDRRPFFVPEQDAAGHGRKTWFDHLVELDPGKAQINIAANYQANPPERIAVLPFVDHGNAQYRVDKISLTHRTGRQQQECAWTYANRLRRSVTGQLAEREFTMVPLPEVDLALQDHGVDNWKKLLAVPPQELERWLDADTVVYGEVLHYEAYYALLASAWDVAARIQLVSTRDGSQLFDSSDNRYAVDVQPAFDMIDFGVNSGLTLLELRDVTLARAEDEVAREIALRVPVSYRALADLELAARSREENTEARADQPIKLLSPLTETSLDPQLTSQALDPPHNR